MTIQQNHFPCNFVPRVSCNNLFLEQILLASKGIFSFRVSIIWFSKKVRSSFKGVTSSLEQIFSWHKKRQITEDEIRNYLTLETKLQFFNIYLGVMLLTIGTLMLLVNAFGRL
jgi:hypothetical protein